MNFLLLINALVSICNCNKLLIRIHYKLTLAVFCVVCYASVSASNNDTKLKSLQSKIIQVKTDINKKERQQLSIRQQLINLKIKINALEEKYRATVKNLKYQRSVLAKLNNDQIKKNLSLREAQQKLATQIVAAYQVEQANYFKAMFSDTNKPTSSLLSAYHRYIFIARLKQMHNIKNTLEHIEKNKEQIKKQTKILEYLGNDQRLQKIELVHTQQERNELLNLLKNRIASQNKNLEQLLIAKKNLEKLITSLIPKKTVYISPALMIKLCRHFIWPTKGVVRVHFGSPIEQSSWSWNGIIISAPENQKIQAISSGRVVYASWFNGYGLLLIIDHGNGYMSLYGHNKMLYKKVNAKVEAGEVVAVVGKTDCGKPELYFSIRFDGRPVDPEKWCK